MCTFQGTECYAGFVSWKQSTSLKGVPKRQLAVRTALAKRSWTWLIAHLCAITFCSSICAGWRSKSAWQNRRSWSDESDDIYNILSVLWCLGREVQCGLPCLAHVAIMGHEHLQRSSSWFCSQVPSLLQHRTVDLVKGTEPRAPKYWSVQFHKEHVAFRLPIWYDRISPSLALAKSSTYLQICLKHYIARVRQRKWCVG